MAALGMAELAKLGGDVPDGEARVGVEDGVDVPTLPSGHGHQRLVASLPPRPDVLPPLLVRPPQCVGRILV